METKILPIENMSYKSSEIAVDDVSVTYVQTNDCTEDDGAQSITLSTRNNGVARFLNIKTEREGWSFENIEDLEILIEDFKRRALLNDN
jgi:hypothetical protein